MIVKNPTNTDIRVQIEGTTYDLPANGEVSGVLPEHAAYWKVKLHTFVELLEESAKAPKAEKKEEAPVAEAKAAPKKK